MIWDCFTFSGEMDVLNIRMQELKPLDVTHVLVQAFETFSGMQKKCTYFNRTQNDNLLVNTLLGLPEGTVWEREAFQRNTIMDCLSNAKDDDIVIISDADEIPCKEAVKRYKTYMGVAALNMNLYYYYLNLCSGKQVWAMPKILTYGMLKNSTPNEIRNNNAQTVMHDGGWHFSYMGGIDAIKNKIESYSHIEHNTAQFKNDNFIKSKIDNNEFLFDDKKLTLTEIDETYPSFIFNNQSNYSHLIKTV